MVLSVSVSLVYIGADVNKKMTDVTAVIEHYLLFSSETVLRK